ncbi:hypothetical protein [Companilactobacillus paralimentarius]|uniref:hypothetical protein n=1 Tax=Companilactobacillus paralimentarius TaxID=83526 RepID=UPI00126605E3|nr:hypothetical protein [Companilactobacillus paralimentarius]QFR69016.1 hypothetical protein LP238_03675 [Companilactobacillus paralimentarius]
MKHTTLKILSSLLLVASVLALGGCSNNSQNSAGSKDSTVKTESHKKARKSSSKKKVSKKRPHQKRKHLLPTMMRHNKINKQILPLTTKIQHQIQITSRVQNKLKTLIRVKAKAQLLLTTINKQLQISR